MSTLQYTAGETPISPYPNSAINDDGLFPTPWPAAIVKVADSSGAWTRYIFVKNAWIHFGEPYNGIKLDDGTHCEAVEWHYENAANTGPVWRAQYGLEENGSVTWTGDSICGPAAYNVKSGYIEVAITPQERLRNMLKARMAPGFARCRNLLDEPMPIRTVSDIREKRARATLRMVIGDKRYESYRRTGYVTVLAKSGLAYQIYPGCDLTNVYDKGLLVERLCVTLRGDFPPTDSLICRYLMILNNETQFRSLANKHAIPDSVSKDMSHTIRRLIDHRNNAPLTELYREIKAS